MSDELERLLVSGEVPTTEYRIDLDHLLVQAFRMTGLALMATEQGSGLECPVGPHLLPISPMTLAQRLNLDATTELINWCPVHEREI